MNELEKALIEYADKYGYYTDIKQCFVDIAMEGAKELRDILNAANLD